MISTGVSLGVQIKAMSNYWAGKVFYDWFLNLDLIIQLVIAVVVIVLAIIIWNATIGKLPSWLIWAMVIVLLILAVNKFWIVAWNYLSVNYNWVTDFVFGVLEKMGIK